GAPATLAPQEVGTYAALVREGALASPDVAKHFGTDAPGALRALREAIERARKEEDGTAVASLLHLVRAVDAPGASDLLLEVLAWDDAEPPISHRADLFESLLGGLGDARIAPALVAKVHANVAAGRASGDGVPRRRAARRGGGVARAAVGLGRARGPRREGSVGGGRRGREQRPLPDRRVAANPRAPARGGDRDVRAERAEARHRRDE